MMIKREICERLIAIHNRLFHEYAMADGIEDIDVEEIGKDIGSLIIDIAAPEEEKPKSKEAEAVMGTARCPACGLIAHPILGSPFKWRCETHGEFFVYPGETPKAEEETK